MVMRMSDESNFKQLKTKNIIYQTGIWFGGFILISFFIIPIFLLGCKSSSTSQSGPEIQGDMPKDQFEFQKVISSFIEQYGNATDESKKSDLKSGRRKALRKLLKDNLKVRSWIGQLKDIGSNSEGKTFISIKLEGSEIYVKTWNNAINDLECNTLISQGTFMSEAISSLSLEDNVVFHGEFIKDERNYVREGSLDLDAGMTAPKFIMKFSMIKKRTESK